MRRVMVLRVISGFVITLAAGAAGVSAFAPKPFTAQLSPETAAGCTAALKAVSVAVEAGLFDIKNPPKTVDLTNLHLEYETCTKENMTQRNQATFGVPATVAVPMPAAGAAQGTLVKVQLGPNPNHSLDQYSCELSVRTSSTAGKLALVFNSPASTGTQPAAACRFKLMGDYEVK
jgi:hypothetical protein